MLFIFKTFLLLPFYFVLAPTALAAMCRFSNHTTTNPKTPYSSVKVIIGTHSPGIGVTASLVRITP